MQTIQRFNSGLFYKKTYILYVIILISIIIFTLFFNRIFLSIGFSFFLFLLFFFLIKEKKQRALKIILIDKKNSIEFYNSKIETFELLSISKNIFAEYKISLSQNEQEVLLNLKNDEWTPNVNDIFDANYKIEKFEDELNIDVDDTTDFLESFTDFFLFLISIIFFLYKQNIKPRVIN